MIQFSQVTKRYVTGGQEVLALDELSLTIEAGEFVAVRGHSGCGKSTLLALAGGLATPTSGDVHVDGSLISSMSGQERASFRAAKIGFVFQMFHLIPYLPALQNVLVATPNLSSEAVDRANQLLTRFGLADRQHHLPGQLSTGERQRVAMARAILNDPMILLADEPTGNLDRDNANEVLTLLQDFHAQGGTVLLVTHDEFAANAAARTIELDGGRLVEPAARDA